MGMHVGTKVIEFFGGTTRHSSWKTIATQAGKKTVEQVKNAHPAAQVAGGLAVAGGAYVGVAAPTRDAMAFIGTQLLVKTKGGVFKMDVADINRRYILGLSEAGGKTVLVAVKRNKVEIRAITAEGDAWADAQECNAKWKLKSAKGYFSRRSDIKKIREVADSQEVRRIAA